MTTRTKIKEILKGTLVDQTVNVKGWVRTFRNNSFIAINDGSSINNIQAVVNALNNLGIGYFNSYIELGQTFIGTYNDNYTFGQLNIYSTLPSLNYNVNLTTAGTLLVIRDYANVLLNPLILNSPVTQIGAYPVYVGETIEYRIFTGSVPVTSLVTQTNNITGAVTTLSSSITPPSSPFAYLISIANGFSYNITTTD